MEMDARTNTLMLDLEKIKKENEELVAANKVLREQNKELQTDLFSLNSEKQTSEDQFKMVADSIPVIMWTAEANGHVDYFNKRWYDFTGQSETNSHGWGWQPVLHPDDLQRTVDTWNNSLLDGAPYEIEYRFKRAVDGAYLWHLGKAMPARDKDGNITKWFGICTDIQEQKDAQHKKDEFISIASHELKTPLTTVKAFTQIAQSLIPSEQKAFGFISKASAQLQRLEKLISDLLDVSKINAGKMVYNLEEFDFGSALKETVDSVQQTSPQHNIILETSENLKINGDKLRLEQVINNLLTNAIKYSPGADKIIVRSEVQQANIVVSVQDFGIGIAPENLKKLFDRYYRVDNTSMRFQGLGLGLFISSEIIKRHNGSFWIESEEGKGSTFYFLLPISGQQQLTQLDTDDRTFYKSNFVNIQYNSNKHWFEVDWIGYQNYNSVKRGCLILLDLLKKNNCELVLNDNTHVMGNWSEASDWGSEIWFPAMKAAGLRHFAWIYSPSTFSRLAADKSVISTNNDFIHFFNNREEAVVWLSTKQ